MTQHKHIGSSLDDLLESDGALEQVEVSRLLDDKDTGVTIITLIRAGLALRMSWTLQADSDSERA
ncbi:hypothetical protein [Marinobacter psychrophilus]|jgi:antitoxin HicB|uniref:hypothetical protein n=1 Tax=Marinobacter psychrophilus TaxID=330734 RepID=UPI001B4A0205|nr:hypothetical protein [Marinobacter psychrophilus]MBQ0764424.1 hypothetical protein [Marinobacter psychrophilus]MBQ0846586.1 hypothetical protein [Marinobacter psychrophilus]